MQITINYNRRGRREYETRPRGDDEIFGKLGFRNGRGEKSNQLCTVVIQRTSD